MIHLLLYFEKDENTAFLNSNTRFLYTKIWWNKDQIRKLCMQIYTKRKSFFQSLTNEMSCNADKPVNRSCSNRPKTHGYLFWWKSNSFYFLKSNESKGINDFYGKKTFEKKSEDEFFLSMMTEFMIRLIDST